MKVIHAMRATAVAGETNMSLSHVLQSLPSSRKGKINENRRGIATRGVSNAVKEGLNSRRGRKN